MPCTVYTAITLLAIYIYIAIVTQLRIYSYIASYSSTDNDITMRDHWPVTGVVTTHRSVTVMS